MAKKRGPGRPKGSKNKPGHKAGRPRKPGRPKGSTNTPAHIKALKEQFKKEFPLKRGRPAKHKTGTHNFTQLSSGLYKITKVS